jgi:parallel beta-helix repeat protein
MKAKKGDKDFNATPLNLMRGLVTAILVISVLAMLTAVASATTRSVCDSGCDYTSITAAEAASSSYDTIIVHDGTYTENVDVDVDHLTIRSENGSASTTVQAQITNDHVFEVTTNTDYVNISGFNVTGATGDEKAGIYLNTNVDHCNISDNNVTNNFYGIYLDSSSSNTLSGNYAYNNSHHGIYLYFSTNNNNLSGNYAYNNPAYGIHLYYSSSNNLSGNYAYNNSYHGIHLYFSCNNNNLSGNYAYNNSHHGIYLYDSSSNTLSSNTASSNNIDGIYLYASSNNNITCNWVHNNNQRGFWLSHGSTGNTIERNNIIANGEYNLSSGGYKYQFYNDQRDDVEAKDNYWGAGMSNDTINASIYDWQDNHDRGNVTFYEFKTGPSPCAPIPEAATIILLSIGLVVLVGYMRVKRKD